ncbi:hypothetical protein [Archaeoglobus veneficus]|uniref:Uncharacterized protein n=1 Tax=Archaeoglobus veneficus (strain DSM 11195 / SNP6) TaxID=693661 RepID=F2KRA2_ARCVS|nr:hypothetical protein [Archaeoglobus veneficus]AEA47836.1 hypothetical protein Arcve_1840 [Archaeoglobus veneficus SNP6]
MVKKKLEITIGDLTLFEIKQTKKGKEAYIIFPIPDLGTHISLHQSGKMHIKDKYGLKEDITEPRYESVGELLSDFSNFLYTPKAKEVICVRYKMSTGVISGKKIDLLKLFDYTHLSDIQVCEISTALEKLSRRQSRTETYQIIDPLKGRIILKPVIGNIVFAYPTDPNSVNNLFQTKLGRGLLNPIDRYFQKRSDVIDSWLSQIPTDKIAKEVDGIFENKVKEIEEMIKNFKKSK